MTAVIAIAATKEMHPVSLFHFEKIAATVECCLLVIEATFAKEGSASAFEYLSLTIHYCYCFVDRVSVFSDCYCHCSRCYYYISLSSNS